ncbi:hypothetical protein SOV_09830 [Sporomusa ovata DSM 2662]|uniref:Uncharacterized protein n=1 Tax=Sporomusa ovata TaxID=2378 RepID=A0A0U1KXK1_9FIRM|nr:hypothetical protein [Sporomusa ovata]EQB28632.1 hypothetical protein SOV_1c03210 [Sporomusa ovata DSM 2662]CQR72140.1 hypothetical protein SpAn4DRAFT_5029 [Sporomusa ovata]
MVEAITRKDFERAIRDFKQIMDSMLMADRQSYVTRVKELVTLIETNHILKSFMQPYLDIPIEVKEIIPEWGKFYLPSESDKQIAFVLKLFYEVNQGKCNLDIRLYEAFGNKTLNQNYYSFNNNVIRNFHSKILQKLYDFLEDQFQSKDEPINQAKVINYTDNRTTNHYEITGNTQSNIAAGGDYNTQSIELGFSEKVISNLVNLHKFTLQQIEEIKPALKVLEEEQKKDIPDKGILQKAWDTIYSIGGKVALSVTTQYIIHSGILQSATAFVMSLV